MKHISLPLCSGFALHCVAEIKGGGSEEQRRVVGVGGSLGFSFASAHTCDAPGVLTCVRKMLHNAQPTEDDRKTRFSFFFFASVHLHLLIPKTNPENTYEEKKPSWFHYIGDSSVSNPPPLPHHRSSGSTHITG